MASSSMESWLHDRLCKFLNNTDTDTSVFLTYIISLLTDEDASLDEKRDSIEPILQDLDMSKSSDEVASLFDEVINKWSELSATNTQSSGDANNTSNKSTDNLNKENSKEDAGDAILNLIKGHKAQVVLNKRENRTTGDDYEPYVDYDASHDNRIYHSDNDDEDDEVRDDGLFKNDNAEAVAQREKQNKEKLAEKHLKEKERIKKDQIAQKEREEERKKRAKQKAAKVERKA